jgi:[ribosomal protein S18]-alanine N-acetyltransferase
MPDPAPVDPEVRIRPLGLGDLDALQELDAAVFGHMAYPFFVLRQLFDLHRRYWVIAEGRNGMRGYTLAVPASDLTCGWLLGLGVREEFRRMGCGRLLAVAALELLTASGVPEAKLTVEPDNVSAIALYEEVGFRVAEEFKDYLGPGEDRIVMIARLGR